MANPMTARSGVDDSVRAMAEAVLLPGFRGTTAPDWVRARVAAGLGGVVLFGRNVVDDEQVAALTAALRAERDDVVVGIDEEGGDVTRLDAATGSDLPGPLAMGAAGDLALTAEVGAALGARLAACGVTVNLAPCADLTLSQDDPIIGVRAFGSDPYAAAAHVGAFVRGHQRVGVAACAKHFPGHGASTSDSHVALPVLPRTPEELRACELVPFRAALAAGVRAVMTGHLVVPGWGDDPVTLNSVAINEILRGELGFTGAVITDALEMGAVAGTFGDTDGLTEAAVRALRAGADALCIGGEEAGPEVLDRIVGRIAAAVADGTLDEQRLAEAAARTRALGTAPEHGGHPAPRRQDIGRGDGSADTTTGLWTTGERLSTPADHPSPPPSSPAYPGGGGPDSHRHRLGITVARKAIRATALPELEDPLVLDVEVDPTIAAGPVPWGLGPHLSELVPETTVLRVDAAEPADALAAARTAAGVVIVTRDAHRHPAVRALVAELVHTNPVTVHVETGVPGPDLGASARIDTFGASRPSLRAAAETVAEACRH
ncbi:beta-N-acetylhexosaminidase [Actinokineospora fastidiosa]|uniref:Beta-N-acetylhexosaminidase n=2 Tax=Actinokineospora fastidiosa TaxID=1816 RepID=A0A918GR51_9PSEU|nr:beta-N-acetylhexosaminidase [Actinokineospora fastidiosa]